MMGSGGPTAALQERVCYTDHDSVQGTHTERRHQHGPQKPGSLYRASNVLTGAGRTNRSLLARGKGKEGQKVQGYMKGILGREISKD